MDRRSLDLVDARDSRVEQIWRSLEAHGQPSYFLSWGWIENWLSCLPADELPSLAVVRDRDDAPAAAFFLARRTRRRNLVLQKNALYFNSTGSRQHDEIGIEHNRMLAMPGARRSLTGILDLIPGEWDELHLPAVDRYAFDDLAAPTRPSSRYQITVEQETSAPFVDLEAVRTVDGGYEALLPASTRMVLRRSRDKLGTLDVEVATDERHAMDIYGELLRLHARRWAARGMRGVFADSWFERFHRRLILSRLSRGEIQLVRVRGGGETIGCLYNFVHQGRVLFYQCGLASYEDAELKPGYVCHAAAIEHNALAGHATYDLLGGHAAYKENLATGANRLLWLRVQRSSAPLSSVEETVKRWYELLVGDRQQLALRPA